MPKASRAALGVVTLAVVALSRGSEATAADADAKSSAVDLSKQAERRVAPIDGAFRRALTSSLRSSNVFERRLALERFGRLPNLVTADVVAALVPILEETTPMPPNWCLQAMETSGGGPEGRDQGAEIAYARCLREKMPSNGELAASLLRDRGAFPLVIAHVARHPDSVDAVIASLGISGRGPASLVVDALATSNDPRVRTGLLRLAISSTCDRQSAPVALEPLSALQGSAPVSRIASVAVLRLGSCGSQGAPLVEARKRGVSTLQTGLQDLGDQEIVGLIAMLGNAADALLPAVLTRLERKSKDIVEGSALLDIIGAIGQKAGSATPTLIAILRDRNCSRLWPKVLDAIAAIGPPASSAQKAILEITPAAWSYLPIFMMALVKINAPLDRAQFARAAAAYRDACGAEGRMRLVDNGAYCASTFRELASLARLGGHPSPSP